MMTSLSYKEYMVDYNNYTKGRKKTHFQEGLDKNYRQFAKFFSKYEKNKYNEYINIAFNKYNDLLLKFQKSITIYKYSNIEQYNMLFYQHSVLYSLYINNKISCDKINDFFEEIITSIFNERLIIKGVVSGIYSDLIKDFSE